MSLSKSENIFWKMILEQKKNASNKKEPQEPRHKVTFIKPMMKVNSSILDKIEKFNINSTPQSSLSKKSSKNYYMYLILINISLWMKLLIQEMSI